MEQVLIPLADGLEEIEAVTCIDVLRRAELEVVTAALNEGPVHGSHQILIEADGLLSEVDPDSLSAIVLPGGMPGSANLRDDERVLDFVRRLDRSQRLVAAICAAPIVLAEAGVLSGRKATSYPGFADQMKSCVYREQRVVVSDNIITARGPGVALEFALEIVSHLAGEEKGEELKDSMLVR